MGNAHSVEVDPSLSSFGVECLWIVRKVGLVAEARKYRWGLIDLLLHFEIAPPPSLHATRHVACPWFQTGCWCTVQLATGLGHPDQVTSDMVYTMLEELVAEVTPL